MFKTKFFQTSLVMIGISSAVWATDANAVCPPTKEQIEDDFHSAIRSTLNQAPVTGEQDNTSRVYACVQWFTNSKDGSTWGGAVTAYFQNGEHWTVHSLGELLPTETRLSFAAKEAYHLEIVSNKGQVPVSATLTHWVDQVASGEQ